MEFHAATGFVCKGDGMAKEELIEFDGRIDEALPDGRFRVTLENGLDIVAYTSGKMRKSRIRSLAGDRVTVEMTPYDLAKGRIIYRHKDERPTGGVPARRPFRRR